MLLKSYIFLYFYKVTLRCQNIPDSKTKESKKICHIVCFSHIPSLFNFSTGKGSKTIKTYIFLIALIFSIEWCMIWLKKLLLQDWFICHLVK